jgi:hypothetical protein
MAESDNPPESETVVTLLLLGDAGCGKTTFLSWVDIPYSISLFGPNANIACSRLKHGRRATPAHPGPTGASNDETLRDTDQPFIYDIRFSKKKFTLEMYDTSNPNQHWTTLRPDVVVLAFDISNRETLAGLKAVLIFFLLSQFWLLETNSMDKWRHDVIRYFQHGHGERLPVMMLGLKRDLRKEGEGMIYPQEVFIPFTGILSG